MNIGITATRNGLSNAQKTALIALLEKNKLEDLVLGHGDCIGGDSDAHSIFKRVTYPNTVTIGFPPTNPKYRAWNIFTHRHKPADYLKRNHEIVEWCNLLIGMPEKSEEVSPRSGTWATIRYAVKCNKPVLIIFNNGVIMKGHQYYASKINSTPNAPSIADGMFSFNDEVI